MNEIDRNYIEWCKSIHPDIQANIFINRYDHYYKTYFPIFLEILKKTHNYINEQHPNITLSLNGRVKGKRSFLIKSFETMANNILQLFPDQYPTEENELSDINKQRNQKLKKFFSFLVKSGKTSRFREVKSIFNNIPIDIGTLEGFRSFFDQLNFEEQKAFVTLLGRAHDTFACRTIVNDVHFDINSIRTNLDGQLEISDEHGNTIPISSSIQIPFDKIISDEKTGTLSTIIDGKPIKFDQIDLLYENTDSLKNRTFDNAYKTPDGEVTLFQDMLVINDEQQFNIVSTFTDEKTGDIKATVHQNGKELYKDASSNTSYSKYCEGNTNILNISKLLHHDNINIKLMKLSKEYTDKALYNINDSINSFFDTLNISKIYTRSKDYLEFPKPTGYRALHDSYYDIDFGLSLESQLRDLKMELVCLDSDSTQTKDKDENDKTKENTLNDFSTSHDNYKKSKIKKWNKNPILRPIIEKNPDAFDSSTDVLVKLLYTTDTSIDDLLGRHIVSFINNNQQIITGEVGSDTVFKHIFHNSNSYSPDSRDTLPPLNFDSYYDFLKSYKTRRDRKNQGVVDVDLDDILLE